MKKDIVTIRARSAWLKDHKLTKRLFAETTGNDLGTASIWFKTGRTPRRKYLEAIKSVYPDWPTAP